MKTLSFLALTALLPATATAALTYLDPSAIRALPGAEQNEWDGFTDASGGLNFGDVVNQSNATIVETGGAALLTSGGNIYSPFAATSFTLTDSPTFVTNPGGPFVGNVLLQLKTDGSTLDYGSVFLRYTDSFSVSATATLFGFEKNTTLTSFTPPGSPAPVTSASDLIAYQWDLTGLNVVSYEIDFSSNGSSMSLDQVALDTAPDTNVFVSLVAPVPEPSTVLLGALAGLTLVARRHRKSA